MTDGVEVGRIDNGASEGELVVVEYLFLDVVVNGVKVMLMAIDMLEGLEIDGLMMKLEVPIFVNPFDDGRWIHF